MRGLVMILMTVDHASDAFNHDRVFTDAAFAYHPGMVLPAAQYLTRWMTHLCAPTFVFLAGASLALLVAGRLRRGQAGFRIDRQFLLRGLFILALDPLWMSLAFFGWQRAILQVLYAIGLSMICMAGLRRLPSWLLAGLAVVMLVGADLAMTHFIGEAGGHRVAMPLPVGLMLTGGRYGALVVAYPLCSWLAIMMLGFVFGRRVAAYGMPRPSLMALMGAGSLAVFAVLRGLNSVGNMALYRDDLSVLQWIHVAKYPPSVTYCALELGLMLLFLAAFTWADTTRAARLAERRVSASELRAGGEPHLMRLLEPLRVLGSTAMFFYLLHAHLLMAAASLLGLKEKLGLGAAYLSAGLCVLSLYYPCWLYGRYKRAHPNWFTRLV